MPDETILEEPPERFVLHIDMDSYYASAEISRNPELKEKPVIVGAPPKEGTGRGVVLTCNYVARATGVRSGMPISEAWRLCPTAVYLPPDFRFYEELSGRVMNVIRGFGGRFEQLSIDEAFLEITSEVGTPSDALELARKLKQQLRDETGLTCSIGVGESKSAAKIASDLNKPDKITAIPRGGTKDFLAPLPVTRISGVGSKTQRILQELAIRTIGDLQRANPSALRSRLGRTGTWLSSVANGLDREEVRERPPKSLSTETTFPEDTSDWTAVERVVDDLAGELAERAMAYHYRFRRVGVKVRFKGFETHTREKMLKANSEGSKVIRQEAKSLLEPFRSHSRKVRLVGIKISGLEPWFAAQSSIDEFLPETSGQAARVANRQQGAV